MASLCRSPSSPADRKTETSDQASSSPVMEDHHHHHVSPSTDFITKSVDQVSGNVTIKRAFHDHPLVLSAYSYSYSNVNDDQEDANEFNFCCLCKLYFTPGCAMYSCVQCSMFLHQSCGELPTWIDTARHPQHRLKLELLTRYEKDCHDNGCVNRLWTSVYVCCICTDYNLDIKDALPDGRSGRWDALIVSTGASKLTQITQLSKKDDIKHALQTSIFKKSYYLDLLWSSLARYLKGDGTMVPRKVDRIDSFYDHDEHRNVNEIENVDHQFRHFYHPHPLVFLMFRTEYINIHYTYKGYCIICNDAIQPDDPVYGCHECEYYLHEPCAKLPQSMRNTLHPAHMLQLIQYFPPTIGAMEPSCQICGKQEIESSKYCYTCTDCDVYFDCKCVSSHSFEDHKERDHAFHYLKASLFTCDACGVTENKPGVSCVCTNCPIQVHKRCSNSFPRTLKQNRHHHKLNLVYSFEMDSDYAKETCKLCFNKMNNVYCMYQCIECSYIAHVKCATSKDHIVEDESTVANIEEVVIAEVVKGNPVVVEQFIHQHDLIFTDEEPEIDAVCDACVRPISAPFYACAKDECNFYLHKQCLELPLEIQHPIHKHRLALNSDLEIVRCYGCGLLCNGFIYSCLRCRFYVDARCSLLSDTLKHDGHGCTLTLIDYKYVRVDNDKDGVAANKPKCSACDGFSDSSCMFSCKGCNFHLDLGCALLPKSVLHECPKHDWKPRPLQLTYGGVADASGIYFCDTCEEPRCINHWFYDCADCVWSNHPRCVLGEFQFKYGKTYERVEGHELKLVKKALSRYAVYSCDGCKEPLMDDSPLYCTKCNLYFHRECWYHW